MSRSRRMVLQGMFVLSGATVSMLTPRPAAATPLTCSSGYDCGNNCMSQPSFDCNGGCFPTCVSLPAQCGGDGWICQIAS